MRIHHAFCALAVGAALALPTHAAPLVFNPFVSGTSLNTLLAGNNDTSGFAYAGDKFVGSVYSRTLPEPETYALMLAGLGALGWMSRRRKPAAAR